MRKLLGAAFVAILVGLALIWAQPPAGAWLMQQPTVASYTGPGDVVSGASWYIGGRAYNAASLGHALFNVCDTATGLVCADMYSSATTGFLVPTTLTGGINCTASATTCDIAKAYAADGVTVLFQQTTNASRPTLNTSAANSQACLQFNATVPQFMSGTFSTVAQPWTLSAVAERTGLFTNENDIIAGSGMSYGFLYDANTVFAYNGGVTSLGSIADNAFHTLQGVANTTMVVYSDGSNASTGTGSNGLPATLYLSTNGGTNNPMAGIVCEVGAWPVAFSSTNVSNMQTNQRASTAWNF